VEAKAIRDGLLAVSESLDTTIYGPPNCQPYLTEVCMQGAVGRQGNSATNRMGRQEEVFIWK